MSGDERAAVLQSAATQLGLDMSAHQSDVLLRYLDLIAKWTKIYNLTAVRAPAEMLTHHLIDSLAAVLPLQRQLRDADSAAAAPRRLLDVGSGAGLPGVVFAVMCPSLMVTCVDAVGKKAAFIRQVAAELRLPNLQGLHARVETVGAGFDIVSSRAFASLPDFTAWSRRALTPQGVWLAMKGREPLDELAALPLDVTVFHVEQLQVPGLDVRRCIVWMRPA